MKYYCHWKQKQAGDLRLAEGEVHLWKIAGVGSGDELTAEEQSVLAGISLRNVRNQFLASRSGVRRIAAAYLGCRPDNTIITRPDGGKPVLQGGGSLEFSVSHTGGVVFAAFARMPVGLDVERGDRRTSHFMDIARRYYGAREVGLIENLETEEARREMFHRHWVHKEAMTKLTGDGIAKGLSQAEVCPDGSGKYGGRKVFMAEFEDDGHVGAVAGFREFEVKGWFVL